MSEIVPRVGSIVFYKLKKEDAEAINRRYGHARAHMAEHIASSNGVQVHVGNDVREGQVLPMIITQVWGDKPDCYVNGQVFLDGNDLFWVTSGAVGDEPGQFAWQSSV